MTIRSIRSKAGVRAAALAVSAAALTTLAPAAASAAPAANTAQTSVLTEGVGVEGVLELGQARSDVAASLSAPQCSSGPSCTLATAGDGGYVTMWFENDVVSVLAFENSADGWSTSAGVTPSSSIDDVAAIYSGATRVNDSTVAVDGDGYAARAITDYLCSDQGCQVTGQHLRHYIYAEGDPTYSVNSTEGSVVVTNSSRRARFVTVDVDIFNQAGQQVGGGSIGVQINGRSSVSIDPSTFIDPQSVDAGTYNYVASTGKKRGGTSTGSFSVVGTDELVYFL